MTLQLDVAGTPAIVLPYRIGVGRKTDRMRYVELAAVGRERDAPVIANGYNLIHLKTWTVIDVD